MICVRAEKKNYNYYNTRNLLPFLVTVTFFSALQFYMQNMKPYLRQSRMRIRKIVPDTHAHNNHWGSRFGLYRLYYYAMNAYSVYIKSHYYHF